MIFQGGGWGGGSDPLSPFWISHSTFEHQFSVQQCKLDLIGGSYMNSKVLLNLFSQLKKSARLAEFNKFNSTEAMYLSQDSKST